MKKNSLILTLIVIVTITYGQKTQEKKAKHFTDAAVIEYSLTEEQKSELHTKYIALRKEIAVLNKQFKNEEITQEVKKAKVKEKSLEFKTYMATLTGKTKKEISPFFTRMKNELKEVK